MAAVNLVVMLALVNGVTEEVDRLVRDRRTMAVTAAPPVMMMGVMKWLLLINDSFLG